MIDKQNTKYNIHIFISPCPVFSFFYGNIKNKYLRIKDYWEVFKNFAHEIF